MAKKRSSTVATPVIAQGPKPRVRVRAGSAPSARSAFVTGGGVFGSSAVQPFEGVGNGPRSLRSGDYGPNVVLQYLDHLRRDSRQTVRTTSLAYNAIRKRMGHVVGTGVQPNCDFEDLQELWDQWVERSDFHGRLSFYAQQALAYFSESENGEVFGRFHYPDELDGAVPLQVELIESDRVPTHHTTMYGDNEVVSGIEVDAHNRPVAYWVYRVHPLDFRAKALNWEVERLPVEHSFHMYWPDRIGALRGTPILSRSAVKIRDLGDYLDSELVRKRTTSLFGGYITSTMEDDGSVGIDGEENDFEIMAIEPGTFPHLPPGMDVRFSKPEDVGGNFEVFNRSQVAHAAAGLGLLPEQITNDFSSMASDRVWRAAATDQVPLIEFEQWHKVVGMMSQRVWEQFVARAVACEMWTPPAGVPARKWMYPEWTPPRLMHTHPLQDIRALKEAEELGVTSKRRIAGAMGHNLKTIERERAKEAASSPPPAKTADTTDQQSIVELKAAVADLQRRLDDRD